MFSLSIDWDQIFQTASDLANGLMPVYLIPIGLLLGMAVLGWIMRAIKSAISSGG